jgi:beta-galactosidase
MCENILKIKCSIRRGAKPSREADAEEQFAVSAFSFTKATHMDLEGYRESLSMDFGWRFSLGDEEKAAESDFDDSLWRSVDLPHDWGIEGPFDPKNPSGGSGAWAPGGIGWYRKKFFVPADKAEKGARLEFDGVYHQASVYLNGNLLGRHDYGYSSFAYGLGTELKRWAWNLLAVRVDNEAMPNCRWYSGSGIYRSVRLVFFHSLHVDLWGTSVVCSIRGKASARVSATVRVRNDLANDATFIVENSILSGKGKPLAVGSKPFAAGKGGSADCEIAMDLPEPRLWSPDDPALYILRTRIIADNQTVDEYETRFGVRKAEFRAGKGFFLNGKEMKLRGVCLHHDGGAVGAAVPMRIWERRLTRLKEIGCNAIRCSHNPPDPKFLDLCDAMGFLVIDEAFDKWEGGFSTPEEWWMRQTNFVPNWEKDLVSMLARDRNHPSIILWSVGNETGQPGTDQVDPWLAKLAAFARSFEPTRPVTTAFVSSSEKEPRAKADRIMRSAALVDVLCVNYQEPLYPLYRERDPDKVIVGSEAFPHWRAVETNVHAFGIKNPWFDVTEYRYVAGQFVWAGIDYLGESSSWPNKGWPSGLLDTAGRLKPFGQFHRSVWSSEPMVSLAVRTHGLGKGEPAWSWAGYEIAAHWNWPELANRLLEVEAQTNCDTVELFLNGISYGEKRSADFVNSAVLFLVPYIPGKLRAVGRNSGKEEADFELETAGEPRSLTMRSDRKEICADGRDLAHVAIELVDAEGRRVPRHEATLAVKVTGPGRLLGLDSGDLASGEGYKDGRRTTSGGYCLALVQGTREEGEIEVEAAAEGDSGKSMRTALKIPARAPREREKTL